MLGLGKVGDLDGLEAYWPLHPEAAGVWGAWVAEDLLGIILNDLRLSRGHPLHVDIAVALVVRGGDSQSHSVVGVLQALHVHQKRREEPPASRVERDNEQLNPLTKELWSW